MRSEAKRGVNPGGRNSRPRPAALAAHAVSPPAMRVQDKSFAALSALLHVRLAAVNVPRLIHQPVKIEAVLFAKLDQPDKLRGDGVFDVALHESEEDGLRRLPSFVVA